MLTGAFGLIAAGAAAAVDGGVAIYLLEEGISAVGDAALDDAEGASLADGGAGLPTGMNLESADAAEAGGGELTDGFQEEAGDAGCGC
jgi:hypothetical protein